MFSLYTLLFYQIKQNGNRTKEEEGDTSERGETFH